MIYCQPKALLHHEKALEIAKQIGSADEYADTLYHLGVDHQITKDFDKALKYLNEALSLSRKKCFKNVETLILMSYAECYFELKDYSKAKEFATELLTMTKESSLLWEKTLILLILGKIESLIKGYSGAKHLFEEALISAEDTESPFLIWSANFAYSQCLSSMGKLEKSVACLEKAKAQIDFILSNIPTEDLKEHFLNSEKIKNVLQLLK